MSFASIKIDGFKELEHALTELPQEVGKKILVDSLKLGGEDIRAAITVRTPVGKTSKNPGTLRRSITLRPHGHRGYTGNWFATSQGAGFQFDIGPEYSKARKGYHGHLVERGTKPHEIIAGMKYRTYRSGRMSARMTKKTVLADKKRGLWFGKQVTISAQAKPFLKPGFAASKDTAVRTIHNKLSRDIESTFERMIK